MQGNARLFCKDIISIYESSLKWTSTGGKQLGRKKPYSNVRISTFDSLNQYCLLLDKGSLVESIADIIVENIIEDTLPFKSEVALQSYATNHRGGSLSKRAKKKLQKVQNESTNLAQTHTTKQISHVNRKCTDEFNTELCVSALGALKGFILGCGHEIKPTLHRTVQQHIVQLCLATDVSTLEKSHLYFSDNCRKLLYEALTSLIMFPHHLSPAPLQYAVKILTKTSVSDPSKEVREQCRILIAGVEKIINPQRTMPYFKVSEEELNIAIKELRSGVTNEHEYNEPSTENLDDVINLEDDEEDTPGKLSNVPVFNIEKGPVKNGKMIELEVIDLDITEAQDDSCMIVDDDKIQEDLIPEVSVTNQSHLSAPSNTNVVETILDKIPSTKIPASNSDDFTTPPEKRIKLDEEDLVVDELAETFVDE